MEIFGSKNRTYQGAKRTYGSLTYDTFRREVLYSISVQYGTVRKVVKLFEVFWNKSVEHFV
jgi:hypothetical protein